MAFTPAPTPPNSGDPANFNSRADAFLGWMAAFQAELNATAYPNLPVLARIRGTAALPIWSFEGDPDTGMWSPGANILAWSTGGVERLRLSAEGLLTSSTAINQNSFDTTAGRLMSMGSNQGPFGLGRVESIPASGNENTPDDRTGAGFYAAGDQGIGGSTSATDPYRFRPYIHLTGRANRAAQIVFGNTGSAAGRAFLRGKGDEGWSRVFEVYTQRSVLGAVSQVDGIPTGAIIERGGNANGEYVKFADGTMICTKTITGLGPISTTAGAIFASATLTGGSFAAAFIDDPAVSLQPRASSSIWACRNSVGGPTFVGNFALHSSSTISSTTIAVTVTAIGRWF